MKLCSLVSPKVLAGVLAVVTVFGLGTPVSAGKILDRSLVTVNDEIILESDIDRFLQKAKSKSFQELFGGIDPKQLQSREAILNVLIEERLLNQQVKKLELQATDQEVEGQIRAIAKRNGITDAQLGERLKQLGTSLQDYRDGIRRQIERKNLVEREIKPTLEVNDEQLRHFYLRTAGSDSEIEYKIAHIFVSGKDKAAADKVQKLYNEVSRSPGDFEKVAKESSDDPSTLEAGGVLGFFNLGSLSKEFREVVPKTAPGMVTSPIKTANGYHVVKVLERRSGDFATLSKERKEALRGQLIAGELERRMAMWIDRKKSEAHIRRSTPSNASEKSK